MHRFHRPTAIAAAALLAGFATPAVAQKGHGGSGHQMTPPSAAGIHRENEEQAKRADKMVREQEKDASRIVEAQEKSASKQAKRADKMVREQEHAAAKIVHDQQKAAERKDNYGKVRSEQAHAANAQRKAIHDADKASDRAERRAFNQARHDSKAVLKDIRLTAVQKAQVRAIDRRFDTQLKVLEREDRANEKAGRPTDAALVQRINALRDQERAEVRLVLTPTQVATFDATVARRSARP